MNTKIICTNTKINKVIIIIFYAFLNKFNLINSNTYFKILIYMSFFTYYFKSNVLIFKLFFFIIAVLFFLYYLTLMIFINTTFC